jgi:DNA-binding NarL/FixJ family response regulator
VGRGHDGLEAVSLADALKPDVVVLDLAMPGMGGLQATRLIKAQDEPPFVVVASHFDDAEHREHARRAGADAFISKLNYIAELLPLLDERARQARGGA